MRPHFPSSEPQTASETGRGCFSAVLCDHNGASADFLHQFCGLLAPCSIIIIIVIIIKNALD